MPKVTAAESSGEAVELRAEVDHFATQRQSNEGRTLNMVQDSEQQSTTMTLDRSPIQMHFDKNRVTGTISLPSRLESWQERVSSTEWLSTAIIHDLRNPLGTVYAGAEMLMDLDPAPAQVKRLATNIYRAAGRMRALLADLASASCGRKSTSEICKIRDVIAAASEMALPAAEAQGVQILHDVPDDIEVPLVRSRIERVFFNLITNALEAMPHGGKIGIGARKADNCVLIEVEDTGPGIPRGIRHRLFEPFVTAGKHNGLGLGLALSRETVLDHGGDMWVEPAQGARFVVRLPLRDPHRKESGNSDDPHGGQHPRLVEGGRERSAVARRAAADASPGRGESEGAGRRAVPAIRKSQAAGLST
ncbi:MAG: HAMP domain-containing sensor histidine kinase [Bryobacteraceae bacterium]|jgi:signal transduction histidine kinase